MTSRNTTRARDIDRSNACTLLDAGYGEGQLAFEEHKSRTAAAMSARTLGELESLVTDLQLPTALTDTLAAPARPARSPRPALIVCGAAVAVVTGVVAPAVAQLGQVPNPAAPDKYADVAPTVIAPIDTVTAGGIEQFVKKYRDKFGDTLVYDATFYGDYVGLARVVPDAPGREQPYAFRGGFDAGEVTNHSGDEPPFDLAGVDVGALAGHLLGAADSLRVPGGEISHISMEVGRYGPQVSVYVNNEATGASGHMYLRPNGEVAAVYPYSPTG
ncbi:DUF1707 domain-containing protein [Rhodococcus sp. NPDC058514]|uniref:DUF1707 SHOCT-like domain-containing protein n=1 Tax=unclassified Rhodococcus (in: high G+C Gram-positive bacteria) TaxID=192944 RepID=UPI00366594D7